VANHATSPDPDQLKMYLGGIGGTGNLEWLTLSAVFFSIGVNPTVSLC
jgi:hypothetical protein